MLKDEIGWCVFNAQGDPISVNAGPHGPIAARTIQEARMWSNPVRANAIAALYPNCTVKRVRRSLEVLSD